jgi:hypothetical protein
MKKRLIVVVSLAGVGVYTACSSICDDMNSANQSVIGKVNACTGIAGNYASGPIVGYDAGPNTPDLGGGQVCFYVPACTSDMAKCTSGDQAILQKQIACANNFASGPCNALLFDAGGYFAPSLNTCMTGAGTLSQPCTEALGNNPYFISVATADSAINIGAPEALSVSVLDFCGNPVPYYSGVVHFYTDDPKAIMPADYKFVPSDGKGGGDLGVQSFTLTFNTSSNLIPAGITNIYAYDIGTPSVTGTTQITVNCSMDTDCPSGQVCCASSAFCGTSVDGGGC